MQIFPGQTYAHKRLIRAGARLRYDRPTQWHLSHNMRFAPRWVLVLYHACANGDGGVIYSFTRCGRRWECTGFGRARYCDHANRELVRDLLPVEFQPAVVR